MNPIAKLTAWANAFQQRHPVVAFPYAVIKKFGDDNGGYQAALLTYYGFLSLFPLLLVLVTALHLVFHNNPDLQAQILSGINTYFPLLGEQLTDNIGNMSKTGLGLIIGVLFTLYGARGAADALRFALDNMWQIPKEDRSGFPKNILRSLSIMGIGALGFLATAAASVITSGWGKAAWVKIIVNIAGFIILTLAITATFRIATSRRIGTRKLWVGATIAGVIIQLLLTFGGILVANQLKGLDNLYGTFAIVLGLLFWIYLLAQVLMYAAEVDTVRVLKLWPRSLEADKPTEADKRAYQLQAQTETYIEQEDVKVDYTQPDKPKPRG
jgi:YihY family inner membrane protein